MTAHAGRWLAEIGPRWRADPPTRWAKGERRDEAPVHGRGQAVALLKCLALPCPANFSSPGYRITMVLVRYHGNQDIAIILLVTYMVIVRLGCTLQRENQMLVYIHFVDVRLTLVREH